MTQVIRRSPFNEVLSLREAMNQLFEESFVQPLNTLRNGTIPAMDVYETADSYVVELNIPGYKAEDLDISLEDNVLTVKGSAAQSEQEFNYLVRERRLGNFTRSMQFSTPLDSDKIEASVEHGVLTVHIPKAEAVRPRKITIKSA